MTERLTAKRLAELAFGAEGGLRPFVRETILEPSRFYSEMCGGSVFFKCENLQCTGSFKVRGACNKILSLTASQRRRGVVAASTGNHGAAVAFAAGKTGTSCVIFVPDNAVEDKLETIRQLGGEVTCAGSDCVESEASARAYAAEHGMAYVSPYNDPLVIAGQGTVGVELTRQTVPLDAVFASVGGGGLISGVAAAVKSVWPSAEIVGCSPENSQVMVQSIRAGELLQLPSLPTLSDGTAGGIEAGSVTFGLCCDLVDSFVTVTEAEIAASLRQFTRLHHMLIEGAAAVAIAGFVKRCERYRGKRVAIILCGANISLKTLRGIL